MRSRCRSAWRPPPARADPRVPLPCRCRRRRSLRSGAFACASPSDAAILKQWRGRFVRLDDGALHLHARTLASCKQSAEQSPDGRNALFRRRGGARRRRRSGRRRLRRSQPRQGGSARTHARRRRARLLFAAHRRARRRVAGVHGNRAHRGRRPISSGRRRRHAAAVSARRHLCQRAAGADQAARRFTRLHPRQAALGNGAALRVRADLVCRFPAHQLRDGMRRASAVRAGVAGERATRRRCRRRVARTAARGRRPAPREQRTAPSRRMRVLAHMPARGHCRHLAHSPTLRVLAGCDLPRERRCSSMFGTARRQCTAAGQTMKQTFLEFEQPIAELQAKIDELRFVHEDSAVDISDEIARLAKKSQQLTKDIYGKLSAWQIAQVARHPQRPYTLDYVAGLFTDFRELAGDRTYADDPAIVGGLARFNGAACMVIGHQKGRDTKEKIHRNFGMPRPEGYRKALRLMKLAEKFGVPLFTFVDTPGAYPGIGAEERGQSEAIGRNLYEMAGLRIPIVVTVIGEGGSGGALAVAIGDVTLMLQYATYSVISPEGCASILWKSAAQAPEAAETLGITSTRLKQLGLIDKVVSEPAGGAHRDHAAMMATLKKALTEAMRPLTETPVDKLLEAREDKLLGYGKFKEIPAG